MLRTLVLALNNNTSRKMSDTNRGIGFIDMLTTGSTGSKGINTQIFGVDRGLSHRICFSHNGNGTG